MLRDVEEAATEGGLRLTGRGIVWDAMDDARHITQFGFDIALPADDETEEDLGTIDGYRIGHDWTIATDAALWVEADALDGDVARYIDSLVRELRACRELFEFAPGLVDAQHITIVRHVGTDQSLAHPNVLRAAVASIAAMDAPTIMLVDPWPYSDERKLAAGKLAGRAGFIALQSLGFQRMVGSRFAWAWNRELQESTMAEYSYEALLAAARGGKLDGVLRKSVAEDIHGPLPHDLVDMIDLPDPDDLMTE